MEKKFVLPKPWKSYFCPNCTEWNEIDDSERFMDLTLALNDGFKLFECLEEHINEYESFRERDVREAMCHFIQTLRYQKSSKNDRELTELVLDENLNLRELIELFRVELLMRYSYKANKDGKLIFSQRFITGEPVSSYLNKHQKTANEIRDLICHPTGWKETSEESLRANNPWNSLALTYQGYDLYSTTRTFAVDADRELLVRYNEMKKNEHHKYHLEIPAEPWQGNPLKAKIIILSLNPGWQEKYNKEVALTFHAHTSESIFMEKKRTLLFEAEGFFPYQKETADAINLLSGNYWKGDGKKTGRLSVLKPDTMDEFEFYKKFAVVQYCAYTSKEYGGGFHKGEILPSQRFTKDLIRYIAYNRSDVKFVILRAEDKWKNLLDADVWYTMLPNTIIAKYPIQQRFNKANLGAKKFEELMDIILH